MGPAARTEQPMVTQDPFDYGAYDDAFAFDRPSLRNSSIAAHRRETARQQKERVRDLKRQKEDREERQQQRQQHLHEMESRRQRHQMHRHGVALKKMEQSGRTPKQKKWLPHATRVKAATRIQC